MCDVFAAVLDQLCFRGVCAGFELHESTRRFTPLGIGLRNHCRQEHTGMATQCVFHLQVGDVFAARDDHVFRAIFDLGVAVGLHDRQVAGVEVTARERIGRGLGVFQVPLHGQVAAEHDLAEALPV